MRTALVLGQTVVARLIAQALEREGFRAVFPSDLSLDIPSPGAIDATEKLRKALGLFAAFAPGGFVHPGVSVWAERTELGLLGQEFGLTVVCPPARVVNLYGNKLNLLQEAEKIGVPNLIVSSDPLHSVREVLNGVRRSFPVVLKSVRGSGGFGIFVAHQLDDIENRLPLWLEQLTRNVGGAIVFAERSLECARHVTIPFARFWDGTLELFPSVDASLQSRGRKIVEFCPAPYIDQNVEKQLHEWTRRIAEHTGFVGVGAYEFLVESSRAYLIDGLARLNIGFHLWETIAGTSAVAWQLAALDGGTGLGVKAPSREAKSECSEGVSFRLYAEDPVLQLPRPGHVFELSEPRAWRFTGASASLLIDVKAGSDVSHDSSGMLGLLFSCAEDRRQALTMARGVLSEIWMAGSVQTNEHFLAELLAHPFVREGMFHAGFVDEEFIPEIRPPNELVPLFGSVCAFALAVENDPARWAVGDQWVRVNPGSLNWVGGAVRYERGGVPGVSGVLELKDGRQLRVCAFPVFDGRWLVRIGDRALAVRRVFSGVVARRVLSMVHGRVHSILYRDGVEIPAHEPIAVIESLGMLVPHSLPVPVNLTAWKVKAENVVHTGQELAVFELIGGQDGGVST
jgi:acetyl/propionyl-CoA carboxylase alpha subunit